MAQDPVYATIEDLFSRFTEHDVTRFADETAVLELRGDGPQQLQDAYNGNTVSGTSSEQQAAQEAATSVKEALRDAEAEINAHVQDAYSVPLASSTSNVPRVITRIACDIGLYRLEEHDPRDSTVDRYDRARTDLGKIQNGTMSLGLEGDGDTAEAGGSRAAAEEGPVTFGGSDLDNWRDGGNVFPAQH